MDPTTLLSILERYGLPTLFILVAAPWLAKQGEKIIDAFITNSHPKKELKLRLDDHAYINDKLTEALHELEAETAAVIQFHNGGSNISGLPFERMSVTHAQSMEEYPTRGFQNVMISFVAEIFRQLREHRFMCVDREYPDNATRKLLIGGGVDRACLHAIHDDSRMVGALVIAFKGECAVDVRDKVGRLASEIGVRLDRMRRDAE